MSKEALYNEIEVRKKKIGQLRSEIDTDESVSGIVTKLSKIEGLTKELHKLYGMAIDFINVDYENEVQKCFA